MAGRTSSTYRSPNRVLGSSRAETLSGMLLAAPGCSARSIRAPCPDVLTDRTSPTISPRILTSDRLCSWLPMVSVFRVTGTTGVNRCWKVATASPMSTARTSRKATPADRRPSRGRKVRVARSGLEHPRYPAIRTVVVAPQMASERKKSMTLMATIEVRTALPTAIPTPAGPPLAV